MKLHELPKITEKQKKRVGRGYGTGKGGHTTGRGQKGQKARGKISPLFEGTKVKKSLIQRLPVLRGKGKFKPKAKPLEINLDRLNKLASGADVTVEKLVKEGIVDKEAQKRGVKVLGSGELKKKLAVRVPVTAGAKEKIENAGGRVE